MTNDFKVGMKVRIIPNQENIEYVDRHCEGSRKFLIHQIDVDIVKVQDIGTKKIYPAWIGVWRLESALKKLSEKEEARDKNLKWGVLEVKSQKLHHIFWKTRSMARCARKILQNDHDEKTFKVVKVKVEYLP